MSEQVASLFAFLNSAKVKQKYEFYRNGGGAITGSYLPKSKAGFKLSSSEKCEILEEYAKLTPISQIATKLNRSSDSIRNVLKRAGVYDREREIMANQFSGFKTLKTLSTK